jgi:glycine/D-amino acid oxidase-like deaminating enzyme
MVYLLKAFANLAARPVPPQRRRTIIIGAGPTGISAAFHLGEHALLLERRPALEEPHDLSHHYPLGASRGGALGPQGRSADIQRPGASAAERNASSSPAVRPAKRLRQRTI